MTREELEQIFSEALTGLRTELAGRIDALEARIPAEPADGEAVKAEDLDGIKTALEQIAERIDALAGAEGIEGLNDVAEKALDRIEALEKRSAGRTSLEGQEVDEDGTVRKTKPTLKDAIGAALRGERVQVN